MNKLVCDINLFTLKSPVYHMRGPIIEEVGKFTLEDLPDALIALCNDKDITDITLLGHSYGDTIAENIRTKLTTKNHQTINIKIEVE